MIWIFISSVFSCINVIKCNKNTVRGGKVMQFEPMLKVMIKDYQKSYGMDNVDEDIVFEYFVNHTILRSHQPEAFNVINDICDLICVDGQNDMGIDGIAIKVNDIFISSIEDVDNIVSMYKRIKIEFIFIQSKYKEKFDTGEYGKFVDGVIDFLQVEHYEPHNDKIESWIRIKDYLLSEEIMSVWSSVPDIRTYYVVMGKWNENEHIIAKTKNMKKQTQMILLRLQIHLMKIILFIKNIVVFQAHLQCQEKKRCNLLLM